MKRSLRLEIEQARRELVAAKEALRVHEARSTQRIERGGTLLEVTDKHEKAARRFFDASQAIRQLRRQLEAEQLDLAQKQAAAAAAGAAGIKRKAARRTRKIESVLASRGEKPERRGINKKIAADTKMSPRTAARHLQKIRNR